MISEHLPKRKSKFNRLRVKPKEFEKQLIWLKKRGFTTYTLHELINLDKIPPKSVVLTFDDGYKDNYTNAFRLLKKYNMKATIFIIVDRFGKNWATDKDTKQSSYELNSEEMLSDVEIKTMIKSNLIEIGSHTINHANLKSLSKDDKQKQIINSKEIIEKHFNISCNSFAYPFGFYDKLDVQIVKQANYKVATTTYNDVYNKVLYTDFEIPRIMISGRQNILSFILKIKKGQSR